MFLNFFSKGLSVKIVITALFLFAIPFNTMGFQPGDETPNIFGKTLEGKFFRLSNMKGKPVVVSFFSVKCKPCKKELPEIAHFEKEFNNIRFVAVHVEDNSKKKIEKFIKNLKNSPETIVLASPIVKK